MGASLAEARQLPGHRAWLAFVEGRAVGFVEASLRSYAEDVPIGAPVPYLEGLYVLPGFRRNGVARALVAAVAAWGRAMGGTHLASDAELRNRRSHRVHKALGFDETSRIVTFRRQIA